MLESNNQMIQRLEGRQLFSITYTTEVVKVPGPTDIIVVTGTNPAGNAPPCQGSTDVVSNREARMGK